MTARWGRGARTAKRAMDMLLGIAALITVLPLLLAAMLAVYLADGGPVLHVQARLTRGGRPFRMVKLRTLDSAGRVTRTGGFLRRTHLDEAPQLLNVLAGSMSLVGPRPELPTLHQEICRDLPAFDDRLRVKAGLTGLAQVEGGHHTPADEKLDWDMRYIAARTAWLDLALIARTSGRFLRGLIGGTP